MCYQLVELYAACKCLYYQHAVERCDNYGQPHHRIQPRTISVGYACSTHSLKLVDYTDGNVPSTGFTPPDYPKLGGKGTSSDSESRADTISGNSNWSLSTASTAFTKGGESAIEQLFRDLLNHPELRYLLPQLVRHSGTIAKAERNIARYLRRYARDLKESSSSRLELNASKFIRSCRSNFARRIVECHLAEIGDGLIEPEPLGQPQIEEALLLDGGDADDENRDEDGEISLLYDGFHTFLFDGPPFKSLKDSIELFVTGPFNFGSYASISTRFKNAFANAYTDINSKWTEPRTSPKTKGLWWTCKCGRRIYDNYEELRPGALEDLRVFLAEYGPMSTTASNSSAINNSSTPNVQTGNRLPQQLRLATNSLIGSIRSVGLPRYWQDVRPSEPGTCPGSSSIGSGSSVCKFLLLCVPFMRWGIKLWQPDVCRIHSDRDFFKLLRASYLRHRSGYPWRWFKRVKRLDFVQFEMFSSDLVNIRVSPSMPSPQARQDYDYEPPDTNPPIGYNLTMHLFENPDHAEVYPILFKRTPIKRQSRLLACPQKGFSYGWGVQFIESASGIAVFSCGFIGFILCLITSIIWTVLRDDIQGGFGIGAFVLAFFIFCAAKLDSIV